MSEAIELIPMDAAAFAAFLPLAIASYARENVAAGRWSADGAVQRSADAFAQLLPQGAATPDHCLFLITHADAGVVGSLWYATFEEAGVRQVHVYDLVIAPEHRRRGHAAAAFAAMEARLQGEGVRQIGLHVFAHNEAAQALYRKLGYAVASINMLKRC
jgi:ribosomal protein S18 acetylase RimI-like enzyme